MNYKNKIKEFFIGNAKISDHVPGILKNIHQPESLCLFFSIHTQQELDKINGLLKTIPKPPKKFVVFVFNRADNLTDIITNKSIFCFELADFNIFGRKNDILQRNFSENHFDLLISFANTNDIVSEKLIAEIDSSFKVGTKNPNNKFIFDLLIDYENLNNYQEYYTQVMHYLSVLNITTK